MNRVQARLVDGSDWGLYDEHENKIGSLPSHLAPADVVGFLEFAKQIEAKAYSLGYTAGKSAAAKEFENIPELDALRKANALLTAKLAQHIIEAD